MTLQDQIEQGLSSVKSELQESINVLSIQQQSLSDRLYVIETRNTGPTILTKLQFQNRFTFVELVGIETAAETNAGVRVLQRKLSDAEFVDLEDVDTQNCIAYLVSEGLLTQIRGTTILATGIEPVPEPEPEPEPEPVP